LGNEIIATFVREPPDSNYKGIGTFSVAAIIQGGYGTTASQLGDDIIAASVRDINAKGLNILRSGLNPKVGAGLEPGSVSSGIDIVAASVTDLPISDFKEPTPSPQREFFPLKPRWVWNNGGASLGENAIAEKSRVGHTGDGLPLVFNGPDDS
jgi:hypothetical protein